MKKVDNLNGKSIEDLHSLFTVDNNYGKLYWKERTPEQFIGSPNPILQCQHWNSRFANKQAGGVGKTSFDNNAKETTEDNKVVARMIIYNEC